MELGGEVVTPPAHGSVASKVSAYATLIEYTPNRDYVGSDRFQLSFGPDFNVTVQVHVVPLPHGSAVSP